MLTACFFLLYTWPEASGSLMPDDSRPRHIFLAANLVDSRGDSWAISYFASCAAKKYLVFDTFDCIRLHPVLDSHLVLYIIIRKMAQHCT